MSGNPAAVAVPSYHPFLLGHLFNIFQYAARLGRLLAASGGAILAKRSALLHSGTVTSHVVASAISIRSDAGILHGVLIFKLGFCVCHAEGHIQWLQPFRCHCLSQCVYEWAQAGAHI